MTTDYWAPAGTARLARTLEHGTSCDLLEALAPTLLMELDHMLDIERDLIESSIRLGELRERDAGIGYDSVEYCWELIEGDDLHEQHERAEQNIRRICEVINTGRYRLDPDTFELTDTLD